MPTLNLIGPATITHNGTNIGRTSGGGTLSILEKSYNPVGESFEEKTIPYGVEGVINLFTLNQSLTISSSMDLYSYGEIVITLPEGSITLYHAKIKLPESLDYGSLSHNPVTVRITGGTDTSGNLIKIN